MKQSYKDLPEYLSFLEQRGELVRIAEPVSTVHEITEIHKRVLESGGSVLVFEKPVLPNGKLSDIPVVVNLFGTPARVADSLGIARQNKTKAATAASPDRAPPEDLKNSQARHNNQHDYHDDFYTNKLKEFGHKLAEMKQPAPPGGLSDMLGKVPMLKNAMAMRPERFRGNAPCQQVVYEGKDIDVTKFPIQTCWSGEVAPLVTWPLNITRSPEGSAAENYNMGVYRMQVLGKNKLIARWMAHRGGAKHHRAWAEKGEDMPMAVVIGADPSTIMAAVTPVPDALSEYHFAGLLRQKKLQLTRAKTVPLDVPANAEIVLEGYVSASKTAEEGPYGDHTGYYNAVEPFPVFTVTAITMKEKPVYLSTYTGRPPDEPSIISACLNDVYVPLLQQQFPEIVDCYLPPEACSYRIGVVSIKKHYAGHARRIMMGMWSALPQFSYTKLLIIVDEDTNVRDWKDVMWAVSTRMDPSRDIMTVDSTPIDYLDFASPLEGLGGKMGIDATNKMGSETTREWGRVLRMDDDVVKRVDKMWSKLGTGREK